MIVVTGATGNVGRPLVQTLAAAGRRVTAVSRGRPDWELPERVEHRQADLADPHSLEAALDGAEALFLLAAGGRPDGVLDVARSHGLRRVVLLSSQGARTRPDAPAYSPFRAFEDAVQGSGLDWTILRPGGFHSNALWWREVVRSARVVPAPFADVGLPIVDPADIAEVAALALRDGEHTGRAYELTGPAPVTPRQQAQAIGDALGTPVRLVEQSRDEARAQMLRVMPEPVVEGTLAILGEPSGAEVRVSPDVERVLGRPARTFADWARRNAEAFR
jgi:uncharacterized protein YbjT (DUF2867 family)